MRALRRGDRGRGVVDLQTRLLNLGFELGNRGIDGVFGSRTEFAVKAFQQDIGILADGLVGEITWNEIYEAGYRPGGRLIYVRQPPFRGTDVMELQRMLNDLGFDPGAVNGLFDERTARATREFQRNRGFTEADLNLAVAQDLAQILPARQVLLTRGDDEEVSHSDRAYLANSSGAKMVISIHHAHHGSPRAEGTTSFYFSRLGYQSHRGRMAATYLQRGVSRALNTLDIGELGRSYDILRETNIPAVVVEPLYLTNPRELELASDPYYPTTVAEAIAGALELYVGRDAAFIALS